MSPIYCSGPLVNIDSLAFTLARDRRDIAGLWVTYGLIYLYYVINIVEQQIRIGINITQWPCAFIASRK